MRIILIIMDNTIKVFGTFKGPKAVDTNTTLSSILDSEGLTENRVEV